MAAIRPHNISVRLLFVQAQDDGISDSDQKPKFPTVTCIFKPPPRQAAQPGTQPRRVGDPFENVFSDAVFISVYSCLPARDLSEFVVLLHRHG
jgi:hypothetical protein